MWSGGRPRTNQGQMRTVPGERLRGTGLGSGCKNVVKSRAAIFSFCFVLFCFVFAAECCFHIFYPEIKYRSKRRE